MIDNSMPLSRLIPTGDMDGRETGMAGTRHTASGTSTVSLYVMISLLGYESCVMVICMWVQCVEKFKMRKKFCHTKLHPYVLECLFLLYTFINMY
jgi:hypothetical protein